MKDRDRDITMREKEKDRERKMKTSSLNSLTFHHHHPTLSASVPTGLNLNHMTNGSSSYPHPHHHHHSMNGINGPHPINFGHGGGGGMESHHHATPSPYHPPPCSTSLPVHPQNMNHFHPLPATPSGQGPGSNVIPGSTIDKRLNANGPHPFQPGVTHHPLIPSPSSSSKSHKTSSKESPSHLLPSSSANEPTSRMTHHQHHLNHQLTLSVSVSVSGSTPTSLPPNPSNHLSSYSHLNHHQSAHLLPHGHLPQHHPSLNSTAPLHHASTQPPRHSMSNNLSSSSSSSSSLDVNKKGLAKHHLPPEQETTNRRPHGHHQYPHIHPQNGPHPCLPASTPVPPPPTPSLVSRDSSRDRHVTVTSSTSKSVRKTTTSLSQETVTPHGHGHLHGHAHPPTIPSDPLTHLASMMQQPPVSSMTSSSKGAPSSHHHHHTNQTVHGSTPSNQPSTPKVSTKKSLAKSSSSSTVVPPTSAVPPPQPTSSTLSALNPFDQPPSNHVSRSHHHNPYDHYGPHPSFNHAQAQAMSAAMSAHQMAAQAAFMAAKGNPYPGPHSGHPYGHQMGPNPPGYPPYPSSSHDLSWRGSSQGLAPPGFPSYFPPVPSTNQGPHGPHSGHKYPGSSPHPGFHPSIAMEHQFAAAAAAYQQHQVSRGQHPASTDPNSFNHYLNACGLQNPNLMSSMMNQHHPHSHNQVTQPNLSNQQTSQSYHLHGGVNRGGGMHQNHSPYPSSPHPPMQSSHHHTPSPHPSSAQHSPRVPSGRTSSMSNYPCASPAMGVMGVRQTGTPHSASHTPIPPPSSHTPIPGSFQTSGTRSDSRCSSVSSNHPSVVGPPPSCQQHGSYSVPNQSGYDSPSSSSVQNGAPSVNPYSCSSSHPSTPVQTGGPPINPMGSGDNLMSGAPNGTYSSSSSSSSSSSTSSMIPVQQDDSSLGSMQSNHFPLTPQSGSSYYSNSSGYSSASSSKCSTDAILQSSNNNSHPSNGGTNQMNPSSTSGCMMNNPNGGGQSGPVVYPNGAVSNLQVGPNGLMQDPSTCSMVNNSVPVVVSISDGHADPNVVTGYTEQEVDFPSINYTQDPYHLQPNSNPDEEDDEDSQDQDGTPDDGLTGQDSVCPNGNEDKSHMEEEDMEDTEEEEDDDETEEEDEEEEEEEEDEVMDNHHQIMMPNEQSGEMAMMMSNEMMNNHLQQHQQQQQPPPPPYVDQGGYEEQQGMINDQFGQPDVSMCNQQQPVFENQSAPTSMDYNPMQQHMAGMEGMHQSLPMHDQQQQQQAMNDSDCSYEQQTQINESMDNSGHHMEMDMNQGMDHMMDESCMQNVSHSDQDQPINIIQQEQQPLIEEGIIIPDKDTFAELEEDLRHLTEGSTSVSENNLCPSLPHVDTSPSHHMQSQATPVGLNESPMDGVPDLNIESYHQEISQPVSSQTFDNSPNGDESRSDDSLNGLDEMDLMPVSDDFAIETPDIFQKIDTPTAETPIQPSTQIESPVVQETSNKRKSPESDDSISVPCPASKKRKATPRAKKVTKPPPVVAPSPPKVTLKKSKPEPKKKAIKKANEIKVEKEEEEEVMVLNVIPKKVKKSKKSSLDSAANNSANPSPFQPFKAKAETVSPSPLPLLPEPQQTTITFIQVPIGKATKNNRKSAKGSLTHPTTTITLVPISCPPNHPIPLSLPLQSPLQPPVAPAKSIRGKKTNKNLPQTKVGAPTVTKQRDEYDFTECVTSQPPVLNKKKGKNSTTSSSTVVATTSMAPTSKGPTTKVPASVSLAQPSISVVVSGKQSSVPQPISLQSDPIILGGGNKSSVSTHKSAKGGKLAQPGPVCIVIPGPSPSPSMVPSKSPQIKMVQNNNITPTKSVKTKSPQPLKEKVSKVKPKEIKMSPTPATSTTVVSTVSPLPPALSVSHPILTPLPPTTTSSIPVIVLTTVDMGPSTVVSNVLVPNKGPKTQALKTKDNQPVIVSSKGKSPTPVLQSPPVRKMDGGENTVPSTPGPSPQKVSPGLNPNPNRRRSTDKKALTIKEGLMRTGDFVVASDEGTKPLPIIWRIEGKSLLQRFEPQDQDGHTVYVNTSSYSAWNPTVRQRFLGVDVRIVGCNRAKIIVEKLGLTKAGITAPLSEPVVQEKVVHPDPVVCNVNQENFEVFIQTLLSQALDPNFIDEIVKENDEYFLQNVQAIDDMCSEKKRKFSSRVKWDGGFCKCIETYPSYSIIAQKNENDLRCRLCHESWSTQIIHFSGDPYDPQTLEVRDPISIKFAYAACDPCRQKVILFSRLHHAKYHFYVKCQKRVEEMKMEDDPRDAEVILSHCLKDTEWVQHLFKELETIWSDCDKMR